MHNAFLQNAEMETNQRLKRARERRYAKASLAAEAMGVPYGTYAAHENGSRGIKIDDLKRYARFFGVSQQWLIFETGDPPEEGVPLVGYVQGGSAAQFYGDGQGPFDLVERPREATDKTVAVLVRGNSMMSDMAENGFLLYYDDRRDPPTEDLIGQLCIVGLPDGRVLVKRLMAAREAGLYHLYSTNEPPMNDQIVEWAARVIWIKPR